MNDIIEEGTHEELVSMGALLFTSEERADCKQKVIIEDSKILKSRSGFFYNCPLKKVMFYVLFLLFLLPGYKNIYPILYS
jgi:hypothetical protein